MRNSRIVYGAVAMLAIGGLAACSSNSSSPSSSSSSSSAATSSAAAAGSTLQIVDVFDSIPGQVSPFADAYNGVQAAVKYINAHGGLNGHPLQASQCSTGGDVNQATTCISNAIKNNSVIAIVGQVSNEADQTEPLLQQAGLASVGPYALTSADYTSKISFPVGIGALADAGAAAFLADNLHFKHLSMLELNGVPAIKADIAAANAALAVRGLPPVKEVGVSTTQQDLSAQAAQVMQGSQGMVPALDPGTLGRMFKAEQQLGQTIPVAADGVVAQDSLYGLGFTPKDLYGILPFEPPGSDGAGVKAMEAQLVANGNKAPYTPFDEYGWAAVQLLKAAVGTQTNITRETVLSGLNSLTSFSIPGFMPTINFTKPSTAINGTVPRLFNSSVIYAAVQPNGSLKVLNNGQFQDPFAKPAG